MVETGPRASHPHHNALGTAVYIYQHRLTAVLDKDQDTSLTCLTLCRSKVVKTSTGFLVSQEHTRIISQSPVGNFSGEAVMVVKRHIQ